jgi:hypothetical protein
VAFRKLTLNFNAGELSPLLASRTDVAKYESGCQRLENFIILPYGGVLRRGGTEYLGPAKLADKRARLIGFNFSVTTNFILEFGEKYIRFWSNGAQVLSGGVPLEKATPYLEADLRTIQYTQINDLMYIVHPNYPPAKLTRLADDNWTYAAISFKWPPLLDENVKNITIQVSATTGAINLLASAAIFSPDDIGSVWQIGHNMAGASQTWIEVPLGTTSGSSTGLRVRGAWSFTTYGSWSGEVRIIRTIFLTGVVETIRVYHNAVDGQRNVSTTGTEDQDCVLRIDFITAGSAGTSNPLARLEFSNAKVYGLVRIDNYASNVNVGGTVLWGLARTDPTIYWSEGAFSKKWGYPRTVGLHEQRLIFGGTLKKPLSIHGSQIDDFENFQRGSTDDSAFLFTLSSNESNPICWMTSQRKLLIGTAGDEWALGPEDDKTAMGPANVRAEKQSSYGSAFLQSRLINEVVLFSQRQARKIRELTFAFEKDGWVAPDLNVLANHISDDGFVETAFASQPDAVFWTITALGNLVGMTYERDQNVVGWHRHSTQGVFESVGTIYGGNNADEVWFSVRRVVNGQPVRYIERIKTDFRKVFDQEDKGNYWYVDSGKRQVAASETTTVTGLSHLEGLTVSVFADGAVQPPRVVTGGQITLQAPAKTILVGLPYFSTLKPMNVDIPMQTGTAQGKIGRIHKLNVRFFKSLCAQFSSDDENWDEIYFRQPDDLMDESPSVFTGDHEVATGANYRTMVQMSVRQTLPFPQAIIAMTVLVDFYGE